MKDLKETTYDRFGLFHMSVVSSSFRFLEAFKCQHQEQQER